MQLKPLQLAYIIFSCRLDKPRQTETEDAKKRG